METIIKGKISKKQDGYVTINKVNCKVDREQYRYIHIGDDVELIQGFFKAWKVKSVRFKNPLDRYQLGVSPIDY